jgi:organic hydroperoxide reductase OsmC/OhrA
VATVHTYTAWTSWTGTTAGGYDSYSRIHQAKAEPAAVDLTLTSDPAFRGDAEQLNPEQLLVLAASSCQLLSFLAAAARGRVDVRSYEDHATAAMPEISRRVRISGITLRPKVSIAKGPSEDRVRHLMEVAHRECYIANSLRTPITVEPEITFVEP